MPEQVNDKTVFTLLEVSRSIQKTIRERYTSSFWVKAEMNKLNYYSHSGHCYPELVQKEEGKTIALVKAMLWADDYQHINAAFIKSLNEPLKDGIKILFKAKLLYDPVYGLSIQILDIDPSYTLGDLEREKQDTISKLKHEGVFDKNKQFKLALLPQRLAIISVETSKGYADFLGVINNQWGYQFFHMLFPSLLQGEKAVDAIIGQLTLIEKVKHHFDVVVIIRGGGGDVGLSCYNNYQLAKAICDFPLPVITGIGHATNYTVVEMVSFANAITPTKIAESLILRFHNYAGYLKKAQRNVAHKASLALSDQQFRVSSVAVQFKNLVHTQLRIQQIELKSAKTQIQHHTANLHQQKWSALNRQKQNIRQLAVNQLVYRKQQFKHLVQQSVQQAGWLLENNSSVITNLQQQIKKSSPKYITSEQQLLAKIASNIHNMDPQNVLKRGYSISTVKQQLLYSINQVGADTLIETQLSDGKIISIVKQSIKNE